MKLVPLMWFKVVFKVFERNYLEQWWFLEVHYGSFASNVRKKPLLHMSNNVNFNDVESTTPCRQVLKLVGIG